MPDFLPLNTARLTLRRFQPADLEPLLAYRNDPEVARYQSWEAMTVAEGRSFILDNSRALPGIPGTWVQIAITLRGSSLLIGDCALSTSREHAALGVIGYTIARPYWRRGYAREALTAWLDYAFSGLKMHRISAVVDSRNTASYRLLEKLGFRREGHFIQSNWYKGSWCDELHYAILRFEWNLQGAL